MRTFLVLTLPLLAGGAAAWLLVGGGGDGRGALSPSASDLREGPVLLGRRPAPQDAPAPAASDGRPGVRVLLDGSPARARIDVRVAGVHGRVVDAATGTPVAGVPVFAVVGASRLLGFARVAAQTVTDAEGRFVLEGLKAGEATVFAFGAGWISEDLPRVDLDEQFNPLAVGVAAGESREVEIRVVGAARLSGRVLAPDGTPAAGATVACSERGRRIGSCGNAPLWYDFGFVPAPPAVSTRPDGRFDVEALVPGVEYWVAASLPDGSAGSARARARAGETGEVEVSLKPPRRTWWAEVSVVEEESGRPIPGAQVGGEETPVGSRTSSDGRVRIGGLGGTQAHLTASAPGRGRAGAYVKAPEGASPPAVASVEIRLPRAATISGRVEMPDGSSAPSACVSWGTRGDEIFDRSPSTYTDGDGRFRLEQLEPDEDARPLLVRWERRGQTFEGETTASPGDEDLVVRLGPARREAGLEPRLVRLLTADGTPVAQARASLHVLTPNEYAKGRLYVSSSRAEMQDGALIVAPKDVPFWIEILDASDGKGTPIPSGPVLFGPFQATGEVEGRAFVLPPGRRVSGHVVDDAGEPVGGVTVEVRVLHASLAEHRGEPSVHATAHTARDGRFAFPRLGDFEYEVVVRTPKRWSAPDPVRVRPPAESVELRLAARAAVTVTVLDPTGRPVEGARVSVLQPEKEELHLWSIDRPDGVTFADGRAALEGLDASAMYVLVVRPPYGLEGAAETRVRDWEPSDITVQLEPLGVVEGTVVDASGRPLAKASVRAQAARDGREAWFSVYAKTDEEGRFRLEGIPPRRARLRVARGPFQPPTQMEVQAPASGVRVVHDPGEQVEVVLAGAPAGPTPVGWRLVALDGDTRSPPRAEQEPQPTTGRLVVGDLAPGRRYALHVHVPEKGLVGYVESFEIGGSAEPLRVTLSAAPPLRGRLVLPPGRGRPGRNHVDVRVGPFRFTADAQQDLSFEVRGVPPGTWAVSAWIYRGKERLVGSGLGSPGADLSIPVAVERR